MTSAEAVPVSDALRREVEAFVFYEARLADESRYEEWEALVTDDVRYWVPAGAADHDPASRLSFVNDNRSRLATRVRQLKSGRRHAQTPPSVMRRLITNVEVLSADETAGEYEVGSNFILHELAHQAGGDVRVWAGRVTHRLRRVEGHLRIAAKTVELVNASRPIPNLTFIL